MNIKLVPFVMAADEVERQRVVIREAYDTLIESKAQLERLKSGPVSALWTEDGKSVDLAAAFTSRYQAALKWLEGLEGELAEASAALDMAVDDVTKLDEQQAQTHNAFYRRAAGKIEPGDTVKV